MTKYLVGSVFNFDDSNKIKIFIFILTRIENKQRSICAPSWALSASYNIANKHDFMGPFY